MAGNGSPKKRMPRHYVFKSATLTDESGRAVSLKRADAEVSGVSRKRLGLRISARVAKGEAVVATIEMSQREAFAFSEWLDAVATDPKGTN